MAVGGINRIHTLVIMEIGHWFELHNTLCSIEGRGDINFEQFIWAYWEYSPKLLAGLSGDIKRVLNTYMEGFPERSGFTREQFRSWMFDSKQPTDEQVFLYKKHVALIVGPYLLQHYPALATNSTFQRNLSNLVPRDGEVEAVWKIRMKSGYPKWPLA
jgi:hypothetical protein